MAAKPDQAISELFQQAVETFDATLKAGVKIQEEAAKWWTQALGDAVPTQGWPERAGVLWRDAIPTARKSADEYLRVIEQGSRSSLELLGKAFEAGQASSLSEAQSKTRALWEATLDALRENAQATVHANARAIEAWAAYAKRHADGQRPDAGPE